MKVGLRTPSPKKSIKARTTGRIKRKVKGSINPLYGKKGMGYIRDPERAIKNKIYHKMTISAVDVAKKVTKDRLQPDELIKAPRTVNIPQDTLANKPRFSKTQSVLLGIAFSILVLSICIVLFVIIFS